MKPKFIDYFMSMAELTSTLSYAKRLQVGAVIVKGNRIIGTGYNGMPTDWDNECEDKLLAYDERDVNNPLDPSLRSRDWEYNSDDKQWHALRTKPEVLHAETNSIAKVAQSTESSAGATMFCTHAPCLECAKLIYQSGIETLYFRDEYRDDTGIKFLTRGGVTIRQTSNKDQITYE